MANDYIFKAASSVPWNNAMQHVVLATRPLQPTGVSFPSQRIENGGGITPHRPIPRRATYPGGITHEYRGHHSGNRVYPGGITPYFY